MPCGFCGADVCDCLSRASCTERDTGHHNCGWCPTHCRPIWLCNDAGRRCSRMDLPFVELFTYFELVYRTQRHIFTLPVCDLDETWSRAPIERVREWIISLERRLAREASRVRPGPRRNRNPIVEYDFSRDDRE